MTDRNAFESWVREKHPSWKLDKSVGGSYLYAQTSISWRSWQAAIEADRAQRSETCGHCGRRTIDSPWPLKATPQPSHSEADVQEILDGSLREWGVFEKTVRTVLGVQNERD